MERQIEKRCFGIIEFVVEIWLFKYFRRLEGEEIYSKSLATELSSMVCSGSATDQDSHVSRDSP